MRRQLSKSRREVLKEVDRLYELNRRGFNKIGLQSLLEAQSLSNVLIGRFSAIAEIATKEYFRREL